MSVIRASKGWTSQGVKPYDAKLLMDVLSMTFFPCTTIVMNRHVWMNTCPIVSRKLLITWVLFLFVQTPQDWLCKTLNSLALFGSTSSVFWMLIEGWYLNSRISTHVFETRTPHLLYRLFAWGNKAFTHITGYFLFDL
jgi:hypothetical protein